MNITGKVALAGGAPVYGYAPINRRYYRPELDVVRFLAFAFVFLYHNLPNDLTPGIAALLRGFAPSFIHVVNAAKFGLNLFFTLSAFLICELLLREKVATGTVKGKQFYLRRILRIWPLYYLALAIGMVAAVFAGGEPDSVIRQLGWYAIFMATWSTAHFGWIQSPVYPLWSVSVEEQFYILAPWVVKFLTRRSLYGFSLAIILLANVWVTHLNRLGADAIWCNALVQFQCFAAGILLCLALNGRLPQFAVWQRLSLLVVSGTCWLLAASRYNVANPPINTGSLTYMKGYALVSLGSVTVLLAFLGCKSKLLPSWAVYLGRISFGLYVFHGFAIYVAEGIIPLGNHKIASFLGRICIGFSLTLLLAALSYRFFETPFLLMKKRNAIIESQPV
jgi:peptidoglycan/LPS O-acetylase OafA/YrhL